MPKPKPKPKPRPKPKPSTYKSLTADLSFEPLAVKVMFGIGLWLAMLGILMVALP